MKMKKIFLKWGAMLALCALTGALLCACAGRQSTGGQTSAESPSQEPAGDPTPSQEEKIVLSTESKSLMYFNDPGHISNESPYNPGRSTVVTKDRLESAVTEATSAGFDVFVNEIYGMVPWYPSEVYSVEEHLDWFYNEFGGKGTHPFLTYTKNGNDFMKIQMDKTHEENKLFFCSYRMNDLHGLNIGDNPDTASVIWISKFFIEHPEYRIGEAYPNISASRFMLDFQYQEVRDYKLAMIRELIENYDEMDGLLLDFMRAPAYFNQSTTTEEQRVNIITGFVEEVKAMLDAKSAETGRDYYFGVILPITDTIHKELGIDTDRLYDAGVRMFVFWDYYMSVQAYDLVDQVKTAHPDVIAYVELSQATSYKVNSNPAEVRYTTAEQFYTCAYTAYAHKADGIAIFNFPFYRNWQYAAGQGIGAEPPFEIMKYLKDPDFLRTAPQHYFIGCTYNINRLELDLRFLSLDKNKNSFSFEMDTIPPEGGWEQDGILRLEASQDISELQLTVKLNGVILSVEEYIGNPYETPYTHLIGGANRIRCFSVPAWLLENGNNVFEVTAGLSGGETLQFTFIDLAIQ